MISAYERRIIRRAVKLLNINRRQFIWSIFAGVMTLVCTTGLAAVSAWLIARASQMPVVSVLAVAATTVRAFGASKPVFRYLRQIASHNVALYGMSHLRSTLYDTLADSRIDSVTQIRRGDLLARTGRDVTSVGDIVVRALMPIYVALFSCLATVAIIAYFSWPAALLLSVCLMLSGVIGPAIAVLGARNAERNQSGDRSELAAHCLTMLESAEELRVAGRLSHMNRTLEQIEQRIFNNRDASARPMAICTAIESIAMLLAVVGSLVIGSHQLSSGTLAPVELAIITLVPLAAFEATSQVGPAMVQLVRSAAAAQRILALLDGSIPENYTTADTATTEEKGLVAHNVHIGWPDSESIAGPISLKVHKGRSLAIVGPSGIGKTTLLYTLAGLLTPKSGSVTLEGKEVSRIPRDAVSTSLVLTAEDSHIFATTVVENIRVARPDITDEEATDLLHRAGLGAWLGELPEGIHTLLGTDATTMSGGERRRLLLARALASSAHYILLDEPAEHLDGETADSLIRDLLKAGGDKTIVLVTHRLTPLIYADSVVVLSHTEGKVSVAATGSHEELLDILPDYRWSLQQEM